MRLPRFLRRHHFSRGIYLRHRALGTEAIYEVVGERAGLIEVEVVSAPGMIPGTRFLLTAAAVRRMGC